MTCLGIVAALPGEARILTHTAVTVGAVCRIADNVLLVWSGIGPERAQAAAERLCAHGATALLSWGCAAALSPPLRPGDLVLPTAVIASDQRVIASDPAWHERLHTRLQGRFSPLTAALAESVTVLATPAQKRGLAEHTEAIAADMESAAVGAVAQEAGLAFAVIRAISDSVDMELPRVAITGVDDCGRIQLTGLLTGLLRYPWQWPALVRLAHGFGAAKATLAGVALAAGDSWLVLS